MALGVPVAPCLNADLDRNPTVAVNELVAAVAAAMDGCAPSRTQGLTQPRGAGDALASEGGR
jgi:hypothetical protein